jgi:hypothetical protein
VLNKNKHKEPVGIGGWPPISTWITPKLKELQMQFEELLNNAYIFPSVSPWGAPILFEKNKYRSLRLCIDFRQ